MTTTSADALRVANLMTVDPIVIGPEQPVVEAERPDASGLSRWQGAGFTEAGPRIFRTVAAAGSAARRLT